MDKSRSLGAIQSVQNHLLITGYYGMKDVNLMELGVTLKVDVSNIPEYRRCAPQTKAETSEIETITIELDDVDSAPLFEHFDKISDRIEQERIKGGKTLVYCAMGISRSSTLCIAYLVKHQHMTVRDAYLHCKQLRPICPNNGFWKQLIDYEMKIRGENSVKMTYGRYFGETPDILLGMGEGEADKKKN